MMKNTMFRIAHKLKIGYIIIMNISINMMNYFTRIFKFSTNILFHYPSMLWNKFSIFKNNLITFLVKRTFTPKSYKSLIWTTSFFKMVEMIFTKSMTFVHTTTIRQFAFNTPRTSIKTFTHSLYYRWKLWTCQGELSSLA